MRTPAPTALVAALSTALMLAACSKDKVEPLAPEPPAITVEAMPAAERSLPQSLPLTGSLVANQQSEVAANASGRVLRTFVERGDFVKQGQALAQLDQSTAALSHAEAQANLRNAQTAATLSNSECARNEMLFKKGAISKDEWERAASQCQTSAGSAQAAQARAQLAQKTLSDSTVRAPFSGMVGERFVSVGEYVQPASKVASIVELDPLRLQLTIREADIGHIQSGMEVQFTVEAFPGQTFSGKVKYIDPTVRSTTRDLIVEATVPNTDHKLKPGMFANASLKLPDAPLLAVPKEALREEADTRRLFAVVQGHVEERVVQVGPERDGYVAILDGLKAGEKVVVNPGKDVKDGVPVKL